MALRMISALREFDQRRVNMKAAAFQTGFGPEIGQGLE